MADPVLAKAMAGFKPKGKKPAVSDEPEEVDDAEEEAGEADTIADEIAAMLGLDEKQGAEFAAKLAEWHDARHKWMDKKY